jgi:hypothetical protein
MNILSDCVKIYDQEREGLVAGLVALIAGKVLESGLNKVIFTG